jgi:hypothetical protein
VTAVPPARSGQTLTFRYDMHLDVGGDGVHPQTFTPEELSPLTGAGAADPN